MVCRHPWFVLSMKLEHLVRGLLQMLLLLPFWGRRLTKKPGQEGKIAVVVGSVTDDKRVYEARVPGLGAPFGPFFSFSGHGTLH